MKRTTTGAMMMLGATAAWGSSYLFMQQGLHTLEPFNLIGLRFGLGFLAAGMLFAKPLSRTPIHTIGWAALLGFLLNLCFWAVMTGLRTTTTGKAGFLLGTTVIFVQLESALWTRRRSPWQFPCAIAAVAGIGLLTLGDNWSIDAGDGWCLASAFGYSWHILLSGVALKRADPVQLGVSQLAWVTVFAFAGAWLWETPSLPHGAEAWCAVLVLGIVCSAAGFLLQATAQKRIDAARAGILFAMEPVFALLLGATILREPLTLRGIAGAGAILAAVIAAQLSPSRERTGT